MLTLTPEAILNPGFQMSFAATLALVSLYQWLAPSLLAAPPPKNSGAIVRLSMRAGKWLLAGAVTSLLAGLATTPYAAFHFQRLAPYGLLANVLAMPAISFIIMPMGVLGVALIPFGYDAFAWQAMGWGIDMMLAIARQVASLPGAEGRIPAFGAGALLAATAGFLMLAIPVSKLRFLGAPLLALALVLALAAPRPDVLIDQEAGTIAVRGGDGRLTILNAKRARISAENWLAADGDTRKSRDVLDRGFRCDRDGCVAKLADGTLVAAPRRPEAFADDCRTAGIVVSRFDVPDRCAAPGVDRKMLATTGALSLRHVDGKWAVRAVRSPASDRPWYGRQKPADPAALKRFEQKLAAPKPGAELPLAEAGDIPVPEAGGENETSEAN